MLQNVKVNLNELPWKDPKVRQVCLSKIEEIAQDSEGFIEGWKYEILPPNIHFVGQFRDVDCALDYIKKLLDKEYIGRVSIERAESPYRVMQRKLPEA